MKIFNIELAPLFIPFERRLQTLSVLYYTFLFLQGLSIIGILTIVYLLFTDLYWIACLYMIWYFYDSDSCNQGGRTIKYFRQMKIWHYLRDYFPVSLIKTTDLDPSKNYLFGFHPHGIMSFGAFTNFCTESTQFSEKFPGLEPHLLVLKEQFLAPIYREYVMTCGAAAASAKSLNYFLKNQGSCKGKSQVCILIVGGAAESLKVQKGKIVLILKKRKGFIRIALETGTDLVPVFSFGENDVFKTYLTGENSILRKFQNLFKYVTHFGLPMFWGRGVFNYTLGLMPLRKPIFTVIGKPILVEKNEHPSEDEINKLHAKYVQELINLFEEHKDKYLIENDIKLVIE